MMGVVKIFMLCVTAALCYGCSAQMYGAASYDSDNMYGVHDPEAILRSELERVAAEKRAQEQRQKEWANILGYPVPQQSQGELTLVNVEEYQTPYGQKLLALSGDEYQRPASYYELPSEEQTRTLEALSEYDPAYYNVTLSGDGNISVSPKYVSSMYGVWGDPYFSSAWAYGYPPPRRGWGYEPWGYYSVWGYPNYSWWGWDNYGMSFGYSAFYDPWWGYSPYYGYGGYGGYGLYYPPMISRSAPRTIVKQSRPTLSPEVYSAPGTTVERGSRRRDGSTVGTSTPSVKFNRGSSNNTMSPSLQTRPSMPSAPSQPSMPRRGNSLGR